MTEKRFTSDKWQVYDNDTVLTVDETVELLNMLHEENQQLKQECNNKTKYIAQLLNKSPKGV